MHFMELYVLEDPRGRHVSAFLLLDFWRNFFFARLDARNGQAVVRPGKKMKGKEAPSVISYRKSAPRE